MSKLLGNVVEQLSSLPTIGRRTALRLALHLLSEDISKADRLCESISSFCHNVRRCRECNNISDDEVCPICMETKRDHTTICVVEHVGDLLSIESSGTWNGIYHVLGGVISPIDGISPSDLAIEQLEENIKRHCVTEVVLALPTTMEGETTSFFLAKRLEPLGVKITTISRGIAIGDEIEYSDPLTIAHALKERRSI